MELITTHPIKKSDLGFHANLFGGKLLAWLDAAAASPLAVYLYASDGFFSISKHGSATPGEYAKLKSR